MGNVHEKERDLILNEYSADYEENNPTKMIVYLSITPEIHYQIQLKFEKYPEKPEIILPSNLLNELGDPSRFLNGLREWNTQNPSHIVELIRELEDILQLMIYPNDEMEEVLMEFNGHMVGPYRLQVSLYSYKMKTYEFQIVHKKPNSPSLILSPELEKLIKVNEIQTLQKWPRNSLIDICREISKKIDHRTRILNELKQLEQKTDYQKNVKKWDAQGLLLSVRIEIETDEFCDLEVTLTSEFPLAPPNLELKSLSPNEIKNDLDEFLLSIYNQWQHANSIVEILDDVKGFLKEKSRHICQICHQFKCPKCRKPLTQTKVRGISGEIECKQQCNSCHSSFHRCCWTDQMKHSRKCPACLALQRVSY